MKRNFKSYAAMACSAVALASCCSEAIEDIKTAGKQQMTFTALQETNVSSRTSLGADLSVLWASGDALSVFDGSSNNAFELSSGAQSSSAQFCGTAEPADKYYAVYPYQDGATLNASTIENVEIPAIQTATPNSFDPKANIMTAVATGTTNFQFKNVCSYAKITTTSACKKIIFATGDNDKIAGMFNMAVDADGIVTSATATENSSNVVMLMPSNGESFEAGTYYIAIKAGDISRLFIQFVGTDKILERSVVANITAFTRASIIDLGTTSEDESWTICSCPDENHPHLIDLGLSVKFACMNIGAHQPEELGDYFSWGEVTGSRRNADGTYVEAIMDSYPETWTENRNPRYIEGNQKKDNTFTYYKWCLGSYNNMTKYKSNQADGTYYDNKAVLDPEDDAATANWGNNWRMPTKAEAEELVYACYWVPTSNYNNSGTDGYIGYKAKSTSDKGRTKTSYYTSQETYTLSDKHIFLPVRQGGNFPYYWTSSAYLGVNYCNCAYLLPFGGSNYEKSVQLSVRAVHP